MAEKDQFQTAEGLEGGLEFVNEASRASQAGRPPAGAVRKAAVAAALALALALAGCSMAAKPESKSTMAASDASMSASSTEQETKWTDAASAEAAAKGAGFDTFGVMEKIEVGDLKFTNPRFSYADGVAQADYETGAAAVIVRKADGKHAAALTDKDASEFAVKWTKKYEGLEVTLYGAARGAATVFTWTDGTQEFGVTYQGLGGEELSMDSDDVAAIVKGLHEANAKTDAAKPASSSSTASANGGVDNPLTEADIKNLVFQNGLGAFDSAQRFQGGDGNWYWSVVTRDTANEPHTWTVDADGNFTSADGAASAGGSVANTLTEADVRQIVFDQGLGAYRYASLIKGDDGVWYWQVCVGDVYDNDHFLLVDPYGNVTEQ